MQNIRNKICKRVKKKKNKEMVTCTKVSLLNSAYKMQTSDAHRSKVKWQKLMDSGAY